MEQWRPCVGYENFYEVSDAGRVRKLRGTQKILSPGTIGPGYQLIGFCVKGKREMFLVHRLVLSAFIGPPPSENHQGAHGDGNPRNNALSNLRWATPKENNADKILHGTNVNKGVPSARAICSPVQVAAIRLFPSIHGAAAILNRELFGGSSIVEPIVRRFSYKTVDENTFVGTPEFQVELDRLYECVYHKNWSKMNAKSRKTSAAKAPDAKRDS